MDDENLPATRPAIPFPAEIHEVTHESSELEIKAINLKTMAFVFKQMGHAWGKADTIDEICKLSLVTAKLLKERMDFLQMPYGHRDSKDKGSLAIPID